MLQALRRGRTGRERAAHPADPPSARKNLLPPQVWPTRRRSCIRKGPPPGRLRQLEFFLDEKTLQKRDELADFCAGMPTAPRTGRTGGRAFERASGKKGSAAGAEPWCEAAAARPRCGFADRACLEHDRNTSAEGRGLADEIEGLTTGFHEDVFARNGWRKKIKARTTKTRMSQSPATLATDAFMARSCERSRPGARTRV